MNPRLPQRVTPALVEQSVHMGVAAYGPLAVDKGQLAQHLTVVTERVDDGLAAATLGDLFLACAIETGVPGAWEALIAAHGPPLQRMLIARNVPAAVAEEVVLALPGNLLTMPRGSPHRTTLGSYDGRGSLRGWLAVHVLRAALRARKARDGAAELDPQAAAAVLHPAEVMVDRECAARLSADLRAAWLDLPPRSRVAVAMRFVHGASGAAIARVLGVGAPRVSRMIDAAVRSLRASLAAAHPDGLPETTDGLRQLLAVELANLAGPQPPEQHGGDPLAPPR